MANVNYLGNPQPDNGWKPQGFLGGMLYRKDRQRYDDNASLQDAMLAMSTQEQAGKLQDYFADQPVRDSERALKVATNQSDLGILPDIAAGKVGEAKSKAAKGSFDSQTLPDQLTRYRTETGVQTAEAPNKIYGSMLSYLDQAATGFGSDLQGQTNYRNFVQSLPPQFQNSFPSAYGPEAEQRIKQVRDLINRKHTQAVELERMKEDAAMARTRVQAGATLGAANIRAGARNQTMAGQLAAAKTPEHKILVARQILADPDATPALQKQAEVVGEAAAKILQYKGDWRYQPAIGGLPATRNPGLNFGEKDPELGTPQKPIQLK